LPERFDLAIMSTKGLSVTAARALADEMCSEYAVPMLILRDYDYAGFRISGTWQRDTRRCEFQNDIRVIELGLNLAGVVEMGLEAEHQHHPKESRSAIEADLRKNVASEADLDFMMRDFDRLRSTRRVELNAMTSPQFVAFVERKLRENRISKVIPDNDLLAEVYVGMEKGRRLEEAVKALGTIEAKDVAAPKDLHDRRKALDENPAMRWDAALRKILAGGNTGSYPPLFTRANERRSAARIA
jgi:hypothetical protein